MDVIQLQWEVLRLQTRIQKLTALLRVLLAVIKISGYSLSQARLPDGNDKRSLQELSTEDVRSCHCVPSCVSSICRHHDITTGIEKSNVLWMTGRAVLISRHSSCPYRKLRPRLQPMTYVV